MYNPLPLLIESKLSDLLHKGKRYFVRQTYRRGMISGMKASFIFRAYFEEEKPVVDLHMQSLAGDPNAFLYDVQDPEHLKRLQAASAQPAGYRIYYAGMKKLAWDPPAEYQNKIRNFIKHRHPSWKTKRGQTQVEVGLYEEYGELFLKFNLEDEEDFQPLDEIEKY